MEQFRVPGASVGLIHGDREEVVACGVTSADNPLAVDEDTLFQIGSITKTYTATAVMRLVEAGRLSLDKPIREYLPDLALSDEDVARSVTMRHLLTHTGGWAGDYFASISSGDDALEQMVGRLKDLEQLTPLGEVWSYNNAGFYIAGRVIEIVTGEPFERALDTLVLAPLGFERSYFFADEVMTYRFAVGHHRNGSVARPWSLGRPSAPVGGLVTSTPELLRYARLQWEPNTFLSADSMKEMRHPHAHIGRGEAMGLGWFLATRDGCELMTHGGATNGQQAALLVAPEAQFALVVLTNHDDGGALFRAIQADLLRTVLGIAPANEAHHQPPVDELREYAGEYEGQLYAVRLSVNGGELWQEWLPKGGFPEPDSPPRPGPPPTRLAFEARDKAIALDGPSEGSASDFLRDDGDEICWYRFGGRLLRRARRLECDR